MISLAIGVPIGYLLYVSKKRFVILTASFLFLAMGGCLLIAPIWSRRVESEVTVFVFIGSGFILLQICLMAAILFSPLQQLTRRLAFVVLGVLTLVALSEISKLNLHQYLLPAKVSEISSPTHNLP